MQNPEAKNPGRYPLSLKIGVLVASLLVPLLIAEAVVRARHHKHLDTDALLDQNRRHFIGDFVTPSDNPDLLYTLKPGVDIEWMGVTVATHETEPVRIPTLGQSASQPAVRIALIGDSMSFGWGLNYENTYGEILREKLQHSLGVPVELKNYSVPGYNSFQERAVLESSVVKAHPDIVVLNYTHNDPDPTDTMPAGYISPEYGDNFLHSDLIKLVLRTLRVRLLKNSPIFDKGGDDEKIDNHFRYAGPL
jgi:hypothetical protein